MSYYDSFRRSTYRAPQPKRVGGPGPIGLLTLEEIAEKLRDGELADAVVLQHPTLDHEQLSELAKPDFFSVFTEAQVRAELARRRSAAAERRGRLNAPKPPKQSPPVRAARDLTGLSPNTMRGFVRDGVLTAAEMDGELARREREYLDERNKEFARLTAPRTSVLAVLADLDDDQVGALLSRGEVDYAMLPVAALLRRTVRFPEDELARAEATRRGLPVAR